MTQKSVSIRANVSIRGVTIRAYALYIIKVYCICCTLFFGKKIRSTLGMTPETPWRHAL